MGLKKGKTVGITGGNRSEWIYAELAVQAAGAIPYGPRIHPLLDNGNH
jgi:long-subunit acyl-CoA synthetase (AMP-forming)